MHVGPLPVLLLLLGNGNRFKQDWSSLRIRALAESRYGICAATS